MMALLAVSISAADLDCFRIHDLQRADTEHYWSVWASTCSARAVYVMIEVFDGAERISKGLWVVYVPHGLRRLNRWTSRVDLPIGATIKVFKVTTDSEVALRW